MGAFCSRTAQSGPQSCCQAAERSPTRANLTLEDSSCALAFRPCGWGVGLGQTRLVQTLPLLLMGSVILVKFLTFPNSQFSHLYSGNNTMNLKSWKDWPRWHALKCVALDTRQRPRRGRAVVTTKVQCWGGKWPRPHGLEKHITSLPTRHGPALPLTAAEWQEKGRQGLPAVSPRSLAGGDGVWDRKAGCEHAGIFSWQEWSGPSPDGSQVLGHSRQVLPSAW